VFKRAKISWVWGRCNHAASPIVSASLPIAETLPYCE
jgi:hypothetical protein